MEVPQTKRLDYLVQLHAAVVTGLVASDRASMGMHLLEDNIAKNRIAPLLNALLDTLIEATATETKIVERDTLLNGENRL